VLFRSRDLWREVWTSVALTVIGAIAGYWLVAADKRWYDAIIAPSLAGGRYPDSSAETLRAVLYVGGGPFFVGFAQSGEGCVGERGRGEGGRECGGAAAGLCCWLLLLTCLVRCCRATAQLGAATLLLLPS